MTHLRKYGPVYGTIVICLVVGLVFMGLAKELTVISSNDCFDSALTTKPNIEISKGYLKGIEIKCETLDAGQVASIYSSIAALITVFLLVATLIWQSIQMSQTVSLFTTQLDWEKSKSVNESADRMKMIVKKYQASPPGELIEQSQINIENMPELISFAKLLAPLNSSAFDEIQTVKSQFEGDMRELHKVSNLMSDLLENDNVLRYTPFDENDRQNIRDIILALNEKRND